MVSARLPAVEVPRGVELDAVIDPLLANALNLVVKPETGERFVRSSVP
jgi:hypothetical protein